MDKDGNTINISQINYFYYYFKSGYDFHLDVFKMRINGRVHYATMQDYKVDIC